MKQRVNEGSSLADALGSTRRSSAPLREHGPRRRGSGALDAVLAAAGRLHRGAGRLKQKVIGTLIYPVIMSSSARASWGS